MASDTKMKGGENFDLKDILNQGKQLGFEQRISYFSGWMSGLIERGEALYKREICSTAGREVTVYDRYADEKRPMLMFGSNNYLGLTSHPYVQEKVHQAVRDFGAGVGGPPLLNGYTSLHREVEERLSAFKKKEETVIFQSGYGSNVGILGALASENDIILYDAFSHASVYDGLRMSRAAATKFAHNDTAMLEELLQAAAESSGDTFVAVEGVYSMDGDVAPLDEMTALCDTYGAILVLDDAHGTGVMGATGRGTPQHFGVSEEVDVVMGTFSKAFGVVGAAVSTSQPIASYLRFFARSYMFSSSIPPAVLAVVLAGLDVLENEPELHQRLRDNIDYTVAQLRPLGFDVHPTSAVIPLPVPRSMNIRDAAFSFHKMGIFINSIEYPAVPVDQQRFRISLMATHTKEDIDRLVACVEEVWATHAGADDQLPMPSALATEKEAVA
ncbi:MAG: aminotransferase class I/II-fold pyridoxal phosphate-dependent enzyme [Bacteroidetes bacterium]|jgi:glycine C-acetyltransferase|nr:aminotransferase class I/II-fold pyridoxal phosphate-dependent enzyme [Bacteroidota bacterium]